MTEENQAEQEVMDEEQTEKEANAEEVIRAAFDEAVSEESDEDSVKMAMIGAGASFKNVTRLYNKFMIDAGFAISKEDRNKAVEDTLEGLDFESEEDFNTAVEALVVAVKGATERSAAALVRAYAKKNEIECYTKPKGAGTARPSFASDFYAFLADNPAVSKEDAEAYIKGEGDHKDTSDNVKKHLSHYMGIWGLVNKIHNA